MRDVWRRLVSLLRGGDALTYTALLWAGTLAGLGRGLAWPWLPLAGLFLMFYAVHRARSRWQGALLGMSFGLGEAGVCFLGSVSWGAQVPLVLTLLCVASHHLPLALWARWAPGALRLRWLWVGTIGFSATTNSLAELLGIPSREAVVLVTTLPELVGGARLFGADLITAFIETGLLVAAYAAASAPAGSSRLDVLRRAARPFGIAAALLAGSAGLASATSAPATGSLLVGVPQINADATYYKSRLLAPQLADAFDRQFSRLNQSLQRAQLVVTTEGFDGRFGLMLPAVRDAWAERARRQSQAWLLTSYIVKADGRKSNAAGAFTADGQFVGLHEKVDLAPFGEPDLAAGKEYRPLQLAPGVALGVLICQESYLQRGSLRLARAGATLLVTTTSDVTFGSSTTVIEHLAMAQLRAIESGRDMIWASNAGPSGVIDRRGRFEAGPFRTPSPVLAQADLYSDLTPFHRFAPFWLWLGPGLLLIASITARREAAPAPVPFSFGPAHRLGRAALAALGVALALATALGTSAAVEARWGKPARAWSAIPDLLASPTTIREPNAYQKFWRPAERSAEGAIAYLLEYYGLDRDDSQLLQRLPPAPSLDVAADFLELHYGLASRRVRLDGDLPLTPMLLRSAQGHFAVVDYAGSGHGGLIDFASGQSRIITAAELAALKDVEALFPYAQ